MSIRFSVVFYGIDCIGRTCLGLHALEKMAAAERRHYSAGAEPWLNRIGAMSGFTLDNAGPYQDDPTSNGEPHGARKRRFSICGGALRTNMPASTSRLSKFLWAIFVLSLLVIIAFLWFGRPPNGKPPEPEVAAAVTESNAEARSAVPSTAAAASAASPAASGAVTNTTSVESPAAELHGQLQLSVLDAQGRPLANSQVTAKSKNTGPDQVTRKFVTDNTGLALVRYPDSGLQTLDVTAEHADYSGRKVLWDLKSGDTVPASYTLKLAADVTIGGTVVDTSANPIYGAEISLHRFWTGNDGNPNRKGEQASFSTQKQTTDAQGRWQARGLPVELLDHIGFDVKHPDFVGTNITVGANSTTEKQLRDGTHRTVLQRGLEVLGRVLDQSDNPVSGAKVWSGRRYYRDRQETVSDTQGRFSFHSVASGETLFSAMAKGRSPTSKTVNVQPGMDEILFHLGAGSVIHAHVQDESGQPVADARVGLEGHPGEVAYDAYEFSGNTDAQGDFTWDSAPNEPVPFYIFHAGFEAKRGVKLSPNQENTVTMRHSRQVQGQVLDATTEQPITKFTLRTGRASPDNSNVYGVIRYHELSAADGKFSISIDEESDDALAAYADGYADLIQRLPEAQNGIVPMVLRLKPSAGVSGIVLAPDGTPAAGITVAFAAGNPPSRIQLTGGRLRSFDARSAIATTDADGHFRISSAPDDGNVVAAGEPGFGQAPVGEVRNSGILRLQAWGRIEGTLKSGGQPAAGKDVLFSLSQSGIMTDFNGYKATTDDQGQFTMENVPPGDGSIVRLIRTSPNSWSHSDSTPVTVQPGQTTQVTIGGNGAMLVGRIRFDNPPTNAAALNFEGNLSGQMPPQPVFNSSEEARAFHSSPEWIALVKTRKNYSLEMKPDGSFIVDNVAPGTYSLNVFARIGGQLSFRNPMLGSGSTPVNVPDTFDPAVPIDIGEVVVSPSAR
jgi:protocatechuate 3,4-dioxygenase beta subunit